MIHQIIFTKILTLILCFITISACTSHADYQAIKKENQELKLQISLVETKLEGAEATIERYKENNSSLKAKLKELEKNNDLKEYPDSDPLLFEIESSELKSLLSTVPHENYPIHVDKYVDLYFHKDSISCKDSSFVYYANLKEEKRYNKEVLAYEATSFEVDCLNSPKLVKLDALFYGSLKVPLAYSVSANYVMVLFLLPPTDEFSIQNISAVYYTKAGKLIYHENPYTKKQESYVSCFSTSVIDLSVISLNTVLESDRQFKTEWFSVTSERELHEWLYKEDNPDVDPKTIPALVFEKTIKRTTLSFDTENEDEEVVLKEEKLEFM